MPNINSYGYVPGRLATHARRASLLIVSAYLAVITAPAIADAVIDPFNEGNTAVTGYGGTPEDVRFFVLVAGAEHNDDEPFDTTSGAPGYGDVLFSNGETQRLFALETSTIGLPEANSRGRVYVEGPGTELMADGGLAIAGNGSVLSVTNGAHVISAYGVSMTDSVKGDGAAQLIVSGPGSYLSDSNGETFAGGRLLVDSSMGEAQVLVSDGGHLALSGINLGSDDGFAFPNALSLGDINADFEVSGAGSVFETDHRLFLTSGENQSARVLDGGRILQTDDFSDVVETPIAFSYSGGDSVDTGLLVSGAGSQIELVNDASFESEGFVTFRDGGSLTTEGSVYIRGDKPGAMQVLMEGAQIDAGGAVVIGKGAEVQGIDHSQINGDVKVNGGVLSSAYQGLEIAGDLLVESGTLALEAGMGEALNVQGTTLFGADGFIRLLLSAIPMGEILIDDYLITDMVEFAPQFSLAAQLDIQFDHSVDMRQGAEFSVRYAALDQAVAYNYDYRTVTATPEIDVAGFPLVITLLVMIFALRREKARVKQSFALKAR